MISVIVLFVVLDFQPSKSGPEHLRMYNERQSPVPFYPMMEQSLVDDARTAYDYGLPASTTLSSNDFSFVDQRVPIQAVRQPSIPTHQSWFGSPATTIAQQPQHAFFNRSFSMPPQTNNFNNADSQRLVDEQQQMAAAALMHQQQNWTRQQTPMFPQAPQQFEQVILNTMLTHSFTERLLFDRLHFEHILHI
jgi:hypothetical protein